MLGTFGVLEEQGRPRCLRDTIGNLSYLENRIHFNWDSFQLSFFFESLDEGSQILVSVTHGMHIVLSQASSVNVWFIHHSGYNRVLKL